MSGRSYGAIQVTNVERRDDADDADENKTTSWGEKIPLLSPESNTESNAQATPVENQSTNGTTSSNYPELPSSPIKKIFQHIWSDLTFDWISPLLHLGNASGQLNVSDLDTMALPVDCETSEVYSVFLHYWEKELERAKESHKRKSLLTKGNDAGEGGDHANSDPTLDELEIELNDFTQPHYKPSLIRALYLAFGTDFLRAGGLKLIHDANLFIGPQVLNRLIQFIRNKDANVWEGIILTLIVTVSQIIMSICLRHYFYKCYTCG